MVTVWRRVDGQLVREDVRFRPWVLLDQLDDLGPGITHRELDGAGPLRYVVRGDDMPSLTGAILRAASRRLGHAVTHMRDLGADAALVLPPEEQYLVASGRTYFRDLPFDRLRRLQVDLETTGLDPQRDRIFLIAVRDPEGEIELIEGADEAALIARLVAKVREADPDVIENHNLHGFDLPFLDRRARLLGVPLVLGRTGSGLRQRGARRGVAIGADAERRVRFIAPGRELIDTLDAVLRHDFATRDLPGHGLKAVAQHLGVAGPEREMIRGDQIHAVYQRDPERVRRYARADVEEVEGLARLLGGPAFALARMAPRRYERLADAGPATGVIDPLLVRAYLRSNTALPAHAQGDGTPHSGAALHLFAAGVAHRIVKADVASLYPSLMRSYRIGPARDHLGAMLALVDRLVERRLAAKASGRAAPAGSPERSAHEAMSAAMKLVVNSAYGYLGAGGLTRFADVHAANEVTRRGREVLELMCTQLAARGVRLLEADTDGVYFAVPASWSAADERRVVSEVGALLPPLVSLELDGRYAAMLSHEPKNYALLAHDGELILRGVAFRSSRAEPFGEAFLRRAVARLLVGDVVGVREAYLSTVTALRRRELPTYEVSSRVRLTKTPEEYLATREGRRELTYEAMLASGRTTWSAGERARVYRTRGGGGNVVGDPDDDEISHAELDRRDYDIEHYVRVLRETFAARLQRAFAPDDFATVFGDPDQLQLFAPSLASITPILTEIAVDP
ncbi:MAG: ribonuclease H-like domain-containing protein [Myxococcales bacterium]|nr:ribonuclease H-like domain-containing protein [Myxococcales bacterium]